MKKAEKKNTPATDQSLQGVLNNTLYAIFMLILRHTERNVNEYL